MTLEINLNTIQGPCEPLAEVWLTNCYLGKRPFLSSGSACPGGLELVRQPRMEMLLRGIRARAHLWRQGAKARPLNPRAQSWGLDWGIFGPFPR